MYRSIERQEFLEGVMEESSFIQIGAYGKVVMDFDGFWLRRYVRGF